MSSVRTQHFVPKRPRFFQIILDVENEDEETTQKKKLWVPRRFVRNHGHDMSKYVQVKDPSGREWKLGCTKCDDGDTWFKNGWQEFADFYSLKHEQFLVFDYERNSRFSVTIFDKTGIEINYPVNRTHDIGDIQDKVFQEINKDETENDIEILDELTPSPKKQKGSSENHSSGDHKTMGSQTQVKKSSRTEKEFGGVSTCKMTGQFVGDENARAFEIDKAFKSQNPFFTILMQPSYASGKLLNFPVSCSLTHITESEGNAILYSNGRRWDVRVHSKKYNQYCSRASFFAGWSKFARENQLKTHDVCVFELIDQVDITFKVHIYRVDRKIGPSLSEVYTHERTRQSGEKMATAVERAKAFKSENPFFTMVMKPSYITSSVMHMPVSFSKEQISEYEDIAILYSNGGRWDVRLFLEEHSRANLGSGWKIFARENRLKTHDVCVFELTNQINVTFHVHIYRCNETNAC